MAPRYTVIKI